MRANLEAGGELMMAEALSMALAPHLGRPEAQGIVQAVCARAVAAGVTLEQAALAMWWNVRPEQRSEFGD